MDEFETSVPPEVEEVVEEEVVDDEALEEESI